MIPIGTCATLACLWEATAPKPGNVYRGADFEDLTYADFLTSAAVVGPILEQAASAGVGPTVLAAVEATRAAVATNTNLGMLLLLAPLAAVPRELPLTEGIGGVLEALSTQDTREVYSAIGLAQPGGLGEIDEADVRDAAPPEVTLVEAMRMAAHRDLVAKQYVTDFQLVFATADEIERCLDDGLPHCDAIVQGYLQLLAKTPDSLIARKCGEQVAQEASDRAASVLESGNPGGAVYQAAVGNFDFWLRGDGHRRNPGASADIIAAALFVLLRDQRLNWPVKFYR